MFLISILFSTAPPPFVPCLNWSLFLPVKFQYMSREVFQQTYLKPLSCLHDLARRKILNQEWESSIFWGSLPLLPDLWPFSSWPVVATANASKHPQPTFKLGEQLIDQKICRHKMTFSRWYPQIILPYFYDVKSYLL